MRLVVVVVQSPMPLSLQKPPSPRSVRLETWASLSPILGRFAMVVAAVVRQSRWGFRPPQNRMPEELNMNTEKL